MDILIEECAEVIQRVTKAKRFGLDEVQREQELNNKERIIYELNDIVATADLLLGGSRWLNNDAVIAKKEKIEKYLKYAREECGTLESIV